MYDNHDKLWEEIKNDALKLIESKEQLADRRKHNEEVASKVVQLFVENNVRISDMHSIYKIAENIVNDKEITLLYR